MSALAETAYAKLNLALHVRARRPDGYHEIETIFAFCEAGDRLEADPADGLTLAVDGPFASGLAPRDNLVMKAGEGLREASGASGGAALRLSKHLPVAAGLGGGSADAAAALRLLSRLWRLDWPAERLEDIARQLGSDVAACVRSVSARGSGRGDRLEPVDTGVASTPVLLVNPRVELSTAEVFAGWDGIDRGPLGDWRIGRNDLEAPAIARVPQVESILAWLSAQPGAGLVRMSGSGATCFALFDEVAACERAAEAVPREWWRLATRLR